MVHYLPWDGSGWTPITVKSHPAGRLATVSIDAANIFSSNNQAGRILSVCTKGQYLSIAAQTKTDYLVLMLDHSLGYIPKENVQLLDYQVIQNPTIGE